MTITPRKALIFASKLLHKRFGNDGLTPRERKRIAEHYRRTAASKQVTFHEREALKAWKDNHRK